MDSFEDHVRELKKRIFRILLGLVLASALSFYFSSEILVWLQNDLAIEAHALQAFEVFYTQIMIAIILGFFISLPYTLYQILKFLRPGLKDKEYRVMRNYLPFSIVLFIGGAAFAYNFVIKAAFSFFQSIGQGAEVPAVWGLRNTLGFAMKISALVGVFFQLPIVALVLGKAGIINADMMLKYRTYFIVGVLVTSAMFTPPDMITQVMITLPVLLLYQVSIYLVRRVE